MLSEHGKLLIEKGVYGALNDKWLTGERGFGIQIFCFVALIFVSGGQGIVAEWSMYHPIKGIKMSDKYIVPMFFYMATWVSLGLAVSISGFLGGMQAVKGIFDIRAILMYIPTTIGYALQDVSTLDKLSPAPEWREKLQKKDQH